ncbi:hypothetical protein [uncultured Ruminococcus sp.]|uniref:hypothetical protein n=1 Tax=uncultured Ruminococcus sp. TaxID=165186 RepID=UPI002671036C|nr:hypothetical protein [uncultured Ruminococcus sp.]
MKTYRIHGDNIVECERIAKIIINTVKPHRISSGLISPSTVSIELSAEFAGNSVNCRLELLPGFNKNTKRRWNGNIFDALKEAGSYFDETPDAIISVIENGAERILLGIEFCSALQAGNQAWQRSARAYSTGRTGCPYIYIVDFVKYELDNETRVRKNLRFPNAAVPYSYVNYSKTTGNFVAQLYTKSEEFDKSRDLSLADFDEDDFGDIELGLYIIKTMLGIDASAEKDTILEKNMNVVQFLADHFDSSTNFTAEEWQEIYNLSSEDIVDYSVQKRRFSFHKTIAKKSHHGASASVIELVDRLSVGLASRDLPFGIIPAKDRPEFADSILQLYPNANENVINSIARNEKHLVIAIFKGFKPRGDDNRPDRGLLPLASMLSSSDVDVMTYLYGPMIEANLRLLDRNPIELADRNGLWRSILALSNYVVLDVPVIARTRYDVERVYDTSNIKNHFSSMGTVNSINPKPAFSSVPVNFGEDDVDTGIHYLFTHILGRSCFEGMCNPPGGDWSGFSVISGDFEKRWLSLPRVSDVVSGKRPDHILEVFGVFEKPLLLSIESKEKSADLETDVGTKLVTYIEKLMDYVPSAKRRINPSIEDWQWGDNKVRFDGFETISAAAYLKRYAETPETVFTKKCEILFVMNPVMKGGKTGWEVEIIPSTERSKTLKAFIIDKYALSGDKQFFFK